MDSYTVFQSPSADSSYVPMPVSAPNHQMRRYPETYDNFTVNATPDTTPSYNNEMNYDTNTFNTPETSEYLWPDETGCPSASNFDYQQKFFPVGTSSYTVTYTVSASNSSVPLQRATYGNLSVGIPVYGPPDESGCPSATLYENPPRLTPISTPSCQVVTPTTGTVAGWNYGPPANVPVQQMPIAPPFTIESLVRKHMNPNAKKRGRPRVEGEPTDNRQYHRVYKKKKTNEKIIADATKDGILQHLERLAKLYRHIPAIRAAYEQCLQLEDQIRAYVNAKNPVENGTTSE